MNKLASLVVFASVIAASGTSFAVEQPSTPAAVPSTVSSKTDTAKPVTAELNDGTKIEITNDGSVNIVAKDGSKTTAPDGLLTLKDGVTLTVKGGKRVSS